MGNAGGWSSNVGCWYSGGSLDELLAKVDLSGLLRKVEKGRLRPCWIEARCENGLLQAEDLRMGIRRAGATPILNGHGWKWEVLAVLGRGLV